MTSECIIPCIENAFVDVEERVICRALQSLTELAQQSLLTKVAAVELVPNVAPLLLHPSQTIHEAAIQLIGSAAASLNTTDRIVLIAPIVQPYLKYSIQGLDINADLIKLAVMSPLSRRIYRRVLFEKQAASSAMSADEVAMHYSSIDVVKRDAGHSPDAGNNDLVIVSSVDESAKNANIHLSPPAYSKIDSVLHELMRTGSEEAEKVKLMSKYIDLAARELTTKSVQWKNGVAAGLSVKGFVSILGRGLSQREVLAHTNLDSLLDISPALMPDHAVQSILVPSQKYGFAFFQPQPEELRCNAIENISTIKSFAKLRAYYGVISNRGEATRMLLNLGSNETTDSGFGASGQSNTYPMAAGNAVAGPDYDNTSATAARFLAEAVESTKAIKRIKALRIPPLPPDFGTLIQPDGRKYK